MGRADLIGNGKQHLVPTYQPIGTGQSHEGKRKSKAGVAAKGQPFRTQHTGLPQVPSPQTSPRPSPARRERGTEPLPPRGKGRAKRR